MTTSNAHIRSAITGIAADWYAAHRAGPLPAARRTEFLAWLKASPQHVEEYLGIGAMENALGAATADPALSVEALVELARSDPSDVVVEFGAPAPATAVPAAPRTRRWRAGAAVAAGLGIVILATVWVLHAPERSSRSDTYRVGHGEQGTWTLADGTILHVNTDTSVTVRFSPSERLLELDHGQVLVRVAHDDRRAFRVHAGDADAVAVGTEFDVFRRTDSTRITVVAGQVAVSAAAHASPLGTVGPRGIGLRVRAGQRVEIIGGVLPGAAQPAPVRETTAWLDHKIVFEQRPLGAVADEFNRYNALPFTVDDPGLRSLKISGSFEADDTASFAAFLRSLDGVRVERLATHVRISSAPARHRAPVRSS